MRALLVFSVLLLSQLSFAQDPAAAPAAPTPAAPATEEAPAVEVPSAFKTGIVVNPSFTMFQRKLDQDVGPYTPANTVGSNSGDVKATELDVKGGYVFDFGLFAGMNIMYTFGKDGNTDMTTYGLGPSVGYSCKYTGLFAAVTYTLFGKAKFENAANLEYDEVSGLQFDIAYPIQLTDKINVGPQLTWRRLTFDDANIPGTAETKTKEFLPSISAWFYF